MDRNFRKLTLERIIKNAGVLTDLVSQTYGEGSVSKRSFTVANINIGPGTTAMLPPNPVKPDGSVDIVINIRGIEGGDTKTASALGVNAVIVTAEAGGTGSIQNRAAFGSAAFVNNAVGKIVGYLQKQYPDTKVHRGKLAVTSFSGGGAPTAAILADSKNIVGGPPDAVIFNDAMHTNTDSPEMAAILDYARKAQQDPSKKFVILHSAIDPKKYPSTTATSNYILQNLNLQRRKVNVTSPEWKGKAPVSVAHNGGVTILQMYDQPDQYYNDPNRGLEKQHWDSRKAGLYNMDKLLGPGWSN